MIVITVGSITGLQPGRSDGSQPLPALANHSGDSASRQAYCSELSASLVTSSSGLGQYAHCKGVVVWSHT